MMANSQLAYINPEILKLARKQCGYTIEQAAKSLLSPKKLEKVERGDEYLTFTQFLKLANRYKRPLAFFYLRKPLKEELLLEDFRTLESREVKFSPILIDTYKKIINKRDFAIKYQNFDKKYDYSLINLINIENKPEDVASIILNILKITMSQRKKWKNEYDALNSWKEAIENEGVLIFQVSGISVEYEMRGFSISELPYPTIVLNRNDSPLGRIFTLIHEFGHLMLKKGGICTARKKDEEHFEIERFCNAISGTVLVPRSELLKNQNIEHQDKTKIWEDYELDQLKKTFWASKEVILRRLLILNKTNKKFYQKKRDEWKKLPKPSKRGGPPPYQKVLTGNSKNYIKIVINAMYEDKITKQDVSYYLDMKLKHLSKLEEKL